MTVGGREDQFNTKKQTNKQTKNKNKTKTKQNKKKNKTKQNKKALLLSSSHIVFIGKIVIPYGLFESFWELYFLI